MKMSVLMSNLNQAREALKKGMQEIAEPQNSLMDMEKALDGLARLIAVESQLMTSQWDDQALGDLT